MRESLPEPVSIAALNRLLRLLCRSLSMYLDDAKPWSSGDQHQARSALTRLIADQRSLAQRVAEAIVRHGGQPEPGPFSSEFAAFNDAGLPYLLREVLDRLRNDVAVIRSCVEQLVGAPDTHALAEEVLGNTLGHIDLLEEATGRMTNSD